MQQPHLLADYVKVKGGSLENGLLHGDLVREIPEAMKPRSIPIASAGKLLEVKPAKVRSTFDLFAIIKRIVHGGAQFRSLAEPWADTSTSKVMILLTDGMNDEDRYLRRPEREPARSGVPGDRHANYPGASDAMT